MLVLSNYVQYSTSYRNGAVDMECMFDSLQQLSFETLFTAVNI